MASDLFGRTYKIVVGTVDITGLRCAFTIRKTLKKEPNTCTIKVYNLSESTREELSESKVLGVSVEAGYKGDNSQLYLGQLRGASSEVEGADITTVFSTGDGDKAIQSARLSIPLGPKTPNDVALLAIARTLGVGLGNVAQAAAKLKTSGVSLFPVGTLLTGNSAKNLTQFCRSAGLEWSIQDGKLQILDIGKALDVRPYVLDSESGLIGSPSLTHEAKTGDKIVRAECLMLPGLRPGMRVMFNSRFVKGLYRVEECEYEGDSWGENWGIRLACRLPKGG